MQLQILSEIIINHTRVVFRGAMIGELLKEGLIPALQEVDFGVVERGVVLVVNGPILLAKQSLGAGTSLGTKLAVKHEDIASVGVVFQNTACRV